MKIDITYAYVFLQDGEKELYQGIYKAIITGQQMITYAKKYPPIAVNKVIKYILLDHPELFWFEGKWGYRELENGMQIRLEYAMALELVLEARRHLDIELEKIVQSVQGNEAQIAKQVYDWMKENISYGKVTSGQTVKDALVAHDAVCKGMAKAYQLLLAHAGIFSVLAEGTIDGKTKHVWNVVKINEKYYHVDVATSYEEVWKCVGIEKQDAYFFGMSDETLGKYCTMDTMQWMQFKCEEDLVEA